MTSVEATANAQKPNYSAPESRQPTSLERSQSDLQASASSTKSTSSRPLILNGSRGASHVDKFSKKTPHEARSAEYSQILNNNGSTVDGVRSALLGDGSSNVEDGGTLISSLDGKAPSVGGKSIASGVTFGMDEKESLRPDDSASIAAAAEDEELAGAHSRPEDSSNGSDEGVRAFREQLNEIGAIDPLRRTTLSGVNQDGAPAQGVLYVPVDVDNPVAPLLAQQDTGHFDLLPDLKLVEALDNPRDRIWVLKLEQDVIDFVKDQKESSLVLPQCNSFYRMLAHKIADYYMLGHSVDDSNSAVRLFKTTSCRIPRPLTGIATPSTAASTPPPSLQMKILRRGIDASGPAIANGSNMPSKSTSENGESCGEDDRKPATREEREARYEAARLRIMGAAKPSEQTEAKDESRSSSVSGRKSRKTKRETSDDDFEARSAYNLNTYVAPQASYQTQQYSGQQQYAQASYTMPPYPQYNAHPTGNQFWYPSGQQETEPNWQQNMYDLSRDFDRSMSFQQPVSPYSAPHSPFAQTNFQQPFTTWPQNSTNNQSLPGYSPYSDRPLSSASQAQASYAYGQLPSQALGRPPNALEHPLPGSYKSRHFNPQSQAFIPHGNATHFRPFLPQRAMSGPNAPATLPSTPSSVERQTSSHSQSSQLGSPGHGNSISRMTPQVLTHPLPQPVFPSQPAQNASLPPKPPMQRAALDTAGTSLIPVDGAIDSTIAKWGNIPGLPAKPPPPSSIDKRETQHNLPQRKGYTMPAFGSMPAGGSV